MPSVEIICVGQSKPTDFSALPFAVEAENRLIGHRSCPSFQKDFDRLQGSIYHLGNPGLRDRNGFGAYIASDLLAEYWDALRFKPEFVPPMQYLLETLLVASPEGKLVFTSDYQFGPEVRRYKKALSLATFWKRHDENGLRANALYWIAL